MPKVRAKVTKNEDRCKNLHTQMNMRVGPTRMQPVTMFVMPDLDPMQKKLNHLENRQNRLERIMSRRAWRNGR